MIFPEENITIDEAISSLEDNASFETYDIINMLNDLKEFRETYVYQEYCRHKRKKNPPDAILFCGK